MAQLPHSAQSFWRESYTETGYSALSGDVSVDVVVVGAGITGLTTAYLLKQAGKTVAVLEKDTVGGGTSGRTTGKVTAQHNLIYYSLQKHRGQAHAKAYATANQTAVETIKNIIQQEDIECDWRSADSVVYTVRASRKKQFEHEAAVATALDLPAQFATHTDLPFDIAAAVTFANQGKMDVQKYLLGLARAIHGNGSFVFEHSNVTGIHDGALGKVRTRHGRVTAKDIVVATNVPCLPLIARGTYCAFEYPIISYIIAAPISTPIKGMYISPDKNQYSILPITSGGTSMLLIGGEGHFSGQPANAKRRQQKLANFGQKHFAVQTVSHRWSDRDYLPYDEVPLVGKAYPWSKHLYVATAFKKWGLSNGTAAGIILRDTICGAHNPWAQTYATNRSSAVHAFPRAVARYLQTT